MQLLDTTILDYINGVLIFVLGSVLLYFSFSRREFLRGFLVSPVFFLMGCLFFLNSDNALLSAPEVIMAKQLAIPILFISCVIWLAFLVRKTMQLPSQSQLRRTNEKLQQEIDRRLSAELQLTITNQHLERLVFERTMENNAILNASPLAIVRLDNLARVTLWNPAAERLFGWSRDEVLGKPLPIIPKDRTDEFVHLYNETVQGYHAKSVETKRLTKAGTLVDVCIWNAPVPTLGSNENSAIAMFDDITEKIRIAAELKEAKLKAERKSTSKSMFLANVSHEIRTPLNAILGYAELLKSESYNAKFFNEYVNIIMRNANSLQALINDVLDLSKVESGELATKNSPFSPKEFFSEVCATLQWRTEEKGLDLHCRNLEELPDFISTDYAKLRQIVLNILGNAIKFTAKGFVEIRPKFHNSLLRIEIEDTGRGLTEDEAKKLFRPFSQANSKISAKYGGTGLGLHLSKTLARHLSGNLYLEKSEFGKGSTFVIEVKAEKVDQQTNIEFRVDSSHDIAKLKGKRVLVIDDVYENRFLVSKFLLQVGAVADTADSGNDGVIKAMTTHPDVILLDIQMPEKDGFETIHELRERGYDGPVVAMTAYSMQEDKDRCREEGFNSHLSKPMSKSSLVSELVHLF